jgi:hypothetical protein
MTAPCPDDPESPPSRPRRRWYQFSLRSLMILTVLAGVLFAAWRWHIEPYRVQRRTMALIERLGGRYEAQTAPIWVNRVTSANLQNVTLVDLSRCDQPEDYVGQVARLPLEVLAVGGQRFTDQHLEELQRTTTLRWLVLDSACVSDAALAKFQMAHPHLQVYRSQRRVIEAVPGSGRGAWVLPESRWTAQYPPELEQLLGKELLQRAMMVSTNDASHVAQLAGAEFLERLDLDRGGAAVTDAVMIHLAGMRSLKTLYLTNRRVTDEGLAHLAGLAKLELLDLSGTPITDAGLVHLAGLTRLKELSVDRTGVTDAGLLHLKGLKNLTRLDVTLSSRLSIRRITEAGVSQLQASLPNCTVRDPHGMLFAPPVRLKE